MNSISDYKVSVIMPVYDAAKYVERAVESVVHLPATGELILIDDASNDNSLEVCKIIAKKYNKVFILTHKDGKNHGASVSRNTGILNAKNPYISFLDADDYYLKNRFEAEEEIFKNFPDVDAVYGFTLAKYESEIAREIFTKGNILERTTFSEVVAPEMLFKALIYGGYGSFHTSGITVKRELLSKTGGFNPKIRYVEDTELWYKLSLQGKLVAGSITEPIAIRWVHETNSIHESDKIKPFRKLMYQELFDWALANGFSFTVENAFFIRLLENVEYHSSQTQLLVNLITKNSKILLSSFIYKKLHLIFKNYLSDNRNEV